MKNNDVKRITTGINGLDEILYGGLISNRSYLVRGGPGTGKTTLGIQFLNQGVILNEKSLLITLSEHKDKILEEFIYKYGSSVEKIRILDLSPSSNIITENKNYNIFEPQEVEWEEILMKITSILNDVRPERIFIDGITQIKYMSNNKYEFRKNLLSLVSYIKELNATAIISSEAGGRLNDEDLQFICDGIFNLDYMHSQRNLIIKKYRNSNFSSGKHTVKLTDKGMIIYPILKESKNKRKYNSDTISTGIVEMNKLLNGGIEKGTSNIFSGPSGVGKTTLGVQIIKEAGKDGDASLLYNFEESVDVLVNRCESINLSVKNIMKNNILQIKNINPIRYSPNEFSQLVKRDVERNNASIVMIDSVTGFKLLFKEEIYSDRDVIRHLHSLVNYLTNENVTVILINEIGSIIGSIFKVTDYGVSYLADNIIFLRYLEVNGKMQKSIGVLKKRLSDYEKNLRHFEINTNGIQVGKSLVNLRGILTGYPEHIEKKKKN